MFEYELPKRNHPVMLVGIFPMRYTATAPTTMNSTGGSSIGDCWTGSAMINSSSHIPRSFWSDCSSLTKCEGEWWLQTLDDCVHGLYLCILYMSRSLVRGSPKVLHSLFNPWDWREAFLDALVGFCWCHSLKMMVCHSVPKIADKSSVHWESYTNSIALRKASATPSARKQASQGLYWRSFSLHSTYPTGPCPNSIELDYSLVWWSVSSCGSSLLVGRGRGLVRKAPRDMGRGYSQAFYD